MLMIFDLDGTLVDSLDDIRHAVIAGLAVVGGGEPTRDQVRSWIGGGIGELAQKALQEMMGSTEHWERVRDVAFDVYSANPSTHCHLYPGVAEMLDTLVAQGHQIAVLSNKPDALVQHIANTVLNRWSFLACIGDGPHGLKPSPVGALHLQKLAGLEPADCMMIGDAPSDVATGKHAGMQTCAVLWGFCDGKSLVTVMPQYMAETPADVVTYAELSTPKACAI